VQLTEYALKIYRKYDDLLDLLPIFFALMSMTEGEKGEEEVHSKLLCSAVCSNGCLKSSGRITDDDRHRPVNLSAAIWLLVRRR
jgi:hypothetical protein